MKQAVFVQDYGVCLPTGDSARGLLCAALAGVPAVRLEKTLALAVGDDSRAHHPCLAVLPDALDLQAQLDAQLAVLADTCDQVLLVLPDIKQERYRRVSGWLDDVERSDGAQEKWIISHQTDGHAQFARLLVALREGSVASFALLGVDSLSHPATLQHYAAAGRLRTDKSADGAALAEGLAWCRFTAMAGRYRWESESTGVEPNHATLAPVALTGLADTLASLVPEGKLPRPSLVVHSRAQTQQDDLEWHHASQRLWPQRLSARANLAMRKGELDAPQPDPQPHQQHIKPALQVGDLGAAALPAAIALACERLSWPLQPTEQALLLDNGDQGERFAALMRHCPAAEKAAEKSEQTVQGECNE